MSAGSRRWLAVSAASAVAFVGLSLAVVTGALDRLDQAWHQRLHQLAAADPALLRYMHSVTLLGGTVFLFAVDTAAVVTCAATRRPRTATILAATAALTWGLRIAVRDLVDRPRPADAFWSAQAAAFPSGHATNSTTTTALVLIAIWPWLTSRASRTTATCIGAICALAVGFSRVLGGVHWPTDVLGGWLLSIAVVAAALAIRGSRQDG